jgi:hypothetical protein
MRTEPAGIGDCAVAGTEIAVARTTTARQKKYRVILFSFIGRKRLGEKTICRAIYEYYILPNLSTTLMFQKNHACRRRRSAGWTVGFAFRVNVNLPSGRVRRAARVMIVRRNVSSPSKNYLTVRFCVVPRTGSSTCICSSRLRLCANRLRSR